jgi:hypothetical protein
MSRRRIAVLAVACATCSRSRAPSPDELALHDNRVAHFAPAQPEGASGFESAPAAKMKAGRRTAPAAAPSRSQGILGIVGSADSQDSLGALVGNEIGEAYGVGGLGLVGGGRKGRRPPTSKEEAEDAEEESAPTRAWFPETFLFAPLVVTGSDGLAKHQVRVPDRLTTWRVLALAHSRAGAQAGAEASFRGTLPTYLDPVVPPFLMTGDEVSLPIQVVNTTDNPVSGPLRLEIKGATLARAPGAVRVPGQGSVVTYAALRAGRPGPVTLLAALGNKDSVERGFPVRPTGRPVVQTRKGTLAAPRTLELTLPDDADRESAVARLQVFPGALAVLRAELAAASDRSEPAGDAYALLLAGRGEKLLHALGGEAQPAELRALAIVAGQRAVRAVRTPDVVTAALFAEPALSHAGNPVLERMGERLAATVAGGQRPDGTFAGGDGWTLQRLLVTTAECVRAVRAASGSPAARQQATRVGLRARGAFERNLARVEDPYTAAAILAAGAVDGATRDKLRERVRKAIRQDPDGARAVPVGKGIVRADGQVPSEVEATALAVLGLRDDPAAQALLPDLGSRLLSAYDPGRGFGDGRTNLSALTAVLSLFAQPLPARVTVTLSQDGKQLGQRVLEGAKLREVLAFEVPLGEPRGTHRYEIRAEPAVPGLGYALGLKAFVPWRSEPAQPGLELAIDAPKDPRVGRPTDIQVHAAAPAGLAFTIRHALPAGVQPDIASLEELVSAGTLRSYHREDGAITLEVAALSAGQSWNAHYKVIPTLAGKLNAACSTITAGAHQHHLAPARWVVR